MHRIAIIPARGGSKRLPRKNILPINGAPMIGYPIQAAILSGLFDDIIVSTEDEEIGNIAESFGAQMISPQLYRSVVMYLAFLNIKRLNDFVAYMQQLSF
ncbi:MAG: hypothetical protein P8047_16285 [Gammaproteobacteria bacterium]